MKYDISKGMTPQIAQLLEIPRHPEPKTWRQNILDAVDATRRERDEAQSQLGDITKLLVEAGLMKRNINLSVESLIEIPHSTQPQLSEIRYVLHGDIQPCSVLYSDDTTTLLRLDEGDMMLETDTIEWSDSVTYRCQELLKSSGLNKINLVRVSGHLAQLVRDERILLNDDAVTGEDEGTYTICVQCEQVFPVNLDLCPHCHTAKGPLPLTLDEAYFRGESTSGVEPEVRFVEPSDAIASIVGSTVAETVNAFTPKQHPADTERDVASRKWADKQREHLASQPKQER